MPIGNYGLLIDRIEDEIRDTTIRANVQDAIRNAVSDYEFSRFYFNENESISFTTSSSQAFYSSADLAVIAHLLKIDTVRVVINGTEQKLKRRDWQWMQQYNTMPGNVGSPTDFCYYNQRLYLYPRANTAYTVQVSSLVRLATLSATGDTNAWVSEWLPELMIRSRAKYHIWAHVKRDDNEAGKFAAIAEDAHQRLIRESTRRLSSGGLRLWAF